MLPRDEERIEIQIKEAEATIERDIAQFNLRHSDRPVIQEVKKEDRAKSRSKETPGEPQTESPSVSKVVDDTTNALVQAPLTEKIKAEKQTQEEHNGEVVMENDEDTVIY